MGATPSLRSTTCCLCGLALVVFFSATYFVGGPFLSKNNQENLLQPRVVAQSVESMHLACQTYGEPKGTQSLPRGMIRGSSDLEMQELWGSPVGKGTRVGAKNLIAIPIGIRQNATVDKMVKKFLSCKFTVMLFHYDGVVDQWREFGWNEQAIHIVASNQTKWWFAKRFLHPDIVADYDYVFLWDEDLELDNFNPARYLSIIKEEGLEISQPALDASKSYIHHQITIRSKKKRVHRRIYKVTGGTRCNSSSIGPPCTGWVEMMAPVFSKASWRCVWHLIQNDLIHAWGLDMKLGYCAMGDRTQNVGVVDAEYIVHKGIPSLGSVVKEQMKEQPKISRKSCSSDPRCLVRMRSFNELNIFERRWRSAVEEDNCWRDPFLERTAKAN